MKYDKLPMPIADPVDFGETESLSFVMLISFMPQFQMEFSRNNVYGPANLWPVSYFPKSAESGLPASLGNTPS